MNKVLSYKEMCTCGDYEPYNPSGIVAALQPYGSCINCYNRVMIDKLNTGLAEQQGIEWKLSECMDDLREQFDSMTPEEWNTMYLGNWVCNKGENK
tara:strand:+ start:3309 stop:3596 length:288 start_codon:yes stop_codon:yes gene_type:complete